MSDPWTKNGSLYGQNFKKLQASHLKSKSLFEDPQFPPNSSSLSYSDKVEGDSARARLYNKTLTEVGNISQVSKEATLAMVGWSDGDGDGDGDGVKVI